MSAPTDVFTTQVSPALDEARASIQAVGLRVHRVFLVTDTYAGTRRKEGGLVSTAVVELLPSPKVHFPSAAQIAASGGTIQAGSAFLSKISRVNCTKHQLSGKDSAGADLAKTLQFYYALKPIGQAEAEFYYPTSDAVLQSTAFVLMLRPLNRRGVLAGITADP